MAPEGQVGQKEMKCILKFEKYFHMSQCYSGERCGPWASCFLNNRIDYISCIKNYHVCLLFFFNIRLHVFISYNELYKKLLFSMQILCIGIYMYP
jgi:hypothetical protein